MDAAVLNNIWSSVCLKLRVDLGDSVFNTWIAPIRVDKFSENTIFLNTSSIFARDWVTNNYADKIKRFCNEVCSDISYVDLSFLESQDEGKGIAARESAPDGRQSDNTRNAFTSLSRTAYESSDNNQRTEEVTDLGIPLDPKLNFENFVVGKPNEFAYAAAQRIAESKEVAFNPLFLYGSVGLGKTHLMHAIAWRIKEREPGRQIAYMSAEKFMYLFVKSVRYKSTMSFKEQFRSVDVLMIDDIQFICGKDSTQEEFFHTFNTLVDNNRQVIISADKSPSDLDGMEERLKSRLGWGLVADIHPTNYELRLGILQSKAALSSIRLSDKVLEFIAHKVTSNVRELEGALNRVIANAMFVGREITIDSVREVLFDLLKTSDRKVSIEEIQKKVASHYCIKLSDMTSARRVRAVALPRQIAMYLAKCLTTLSLPDIGKNFGGRDHSTVLHAVRKVKELMHADSSVAEDVKLLFQILEK